MILNENNNNNQGVFLELLVAAKKTIYNEINNKITIRVIMFIYIYICMENVCAFFK